MSTNDALVLVFERNAFYKRLHYLALGAFSLSLCVLIGLAWMFIFLLNHPTQPLYFATDKVSRLLHIVPINQPNMSTEEVADWAITGIEAAYSFDYLNYRAQIQSASKYFTTYGWSTYIKALKLSGNILAVTARNRIAIARIVDKPKLIAEGLLAGAYAWKFQMLLYVNYLEPPYDDKSGFSNALKVTVLVKRQPPLQGYKGLGFVQFVVEMP